MQHVATLCLFSLHAQQDRDWIEGVLLLYTEGGLNLTQID